MQYEMNRLMKERLKGRSIFELGKQHLLELKLKEVLDKGVTKKDDLIVLNSERFLQNLGGTPYQDSTGKEMWVNKFHIEDFIPEEKREREYVLQQGVACALALQDNLVKNYPEIHFKIIISTDESPDSYPDVCTLGFHSLRLNETWLKEDLEDYRINGLLVITT